MSKRTRKPAKDGELEAASGEAPDQLAEALLREAIDFMNDGFALYGPDGHLEFCNDSFRRINGYSEAETQPGVATYDGLGTLDEAHEAIEHKPFSFLQRIEQLRRDGTNVVVQYHGDRIYERHQSATPSGGMISLLTDITELKKTEAALVENAAMLRGIFENTPVNMNLKDTSGRYLLINKPYADWYGFSPEEIIGKKAGDFFFDAPTAKNLDGIEQAVVETGESNRFETRIEGRDGNFYDRDVIKFPVTGEDGKVSSIGTIVIDITERKLIEADLRRAKDEAEIANKAKSEFLASMSHELRTPLTSVKGSLGLLNGMMADNLSEDQKNLFEISLRNCDAMLLLINELLDYEKLVSGTMVIDTSRHDIGALTSNVVKDNQNYASAQSVTFEFHEPVTPLFADVHEHRFEQVLRNLLSNAAKFSESGDKVEISVSSGEGVVIVSVKDNGVGIPDEFKPRIFEPFTQIDSSPSRKHSGTGLGLSISKSLTEGMGGALYFESELGVGSTFFISLRASD